MQVRSEPRLQEHFHLHLHPRGILQVIVVLDWLGEEVPLLAVSVLACHSVVEKFTAESVCL
jgi:hypothetical protein